MTFKELIEEKYKIKKRVCKKYVNNLLGQETDKCVCGLLKRFHDSVGTSAINLKDFNQEIPTWSVENNTEDDGLSDAYGEVKFNNFSEYSEVTSKVNIEFRDLNNALI